MNIYKIVNRYSSIQNKLTICGLSLFQNISLIATIIPYYTSIVAEEQMLEKRAFRIWLVIALNRLYYKYADK